MEQIRSQPNIKIKIQNKNLVQKKPQKATEFAMHRPNKKNAHFTPTSASLKYRSNTT
jgi:hypothetical protein